MSKDGPFDYLAGLDERGETYNVNIQLLNGSSYGELIVLKNTGTWLEVRLASPDCGATIKVRARRQSR